MSDLYYPYEVQVLGTPVAQFVNYTIAKQFLDDRANHGLLEGESHIVTLQEEDWVCDECHASIPDPEFQGPSEKHYWECSLNTANTN